MYIYKHIYIRPRETHTQISPCDLSMLAPVRKTGQKIKQKHCIYIYIFIHVYIYTYIYMYVYIHAHTHAHTHIYICIHWQAIGSGPCANHSLVLTSGRLPWPITRVLLAGVLRGDPSSCFLARLPYVLYTDAYVTYSVNRAEESALC